MPRVLVVDDEDEIRHVLRDVLTDNGFEVLEARDGEEAVRVFHAEPIDVIILDIIMPRQDGLKCLIELTRQFHDVRVIMISGGGKDQLNLARRFGAGYVFAKPFELDKLVTAVQELVQRPVEDLTSGEYIWRKQQEKKKKKKKKKTD